MGNGGRCPVCGSPLSMRVDGPDGRWCNRCGYLEPIEVIDVPVVRNVSRQEQKVKKAKKGLFSKKVEKKQPAKRVVKKGKKS